MHSSSNGTLAAGPAAGEVPWPRAAKPRSIAILGWARLSAQAREGSGYNLNASELARGLAMSGHRVSYLQSGMTYRLWPRGPHIAARERWGGVECFELRNSPNIAPAAANFGNLGPEIASPEQNGVVLRWLDDVRAEVVHVHCLEGFPLGLIDAIESSGRPVVLTLHNYWFVCPQVDLLYRERTVCDDYDGGRRCAGCLPEKNVKATQRARAVGQTMEHLLGLYPADVLRKTIYGVKPTLRRWSRGRFLARWAPPIDNPDRLADPELARGFESVLSEPGPTDRTDEIEHDLSNLPGEDPRPFDPAPIDQNERVLANRDRHLVVINDYGRRRSAAVAALNRASLVSAPSDFLRRVHVSMGVDEARTRWVRLGQPHFDQINRRARRSPFYAARPWEASNATRPLRFAFLGTVRANKGLEVLAQAIPLLEPTVRRRCQFMIRALGWDWPFRKRLARYPEVSVWGGYDLYQLIAAAGEYDVGILPHIWLENSPLVLLENLHAGKFVLCSRLGGPVDWIVEPDARRGTLGNGLFFPGGRPDELARCITRLVKGEVAVPSPAEVHGASVLRSYPDHVKEWEGIYEEVCSGRAVGAPAPARPPAGAAV